MSNSLKLHVSQGKSLYKNHITLFAEVLEFVRTNKNGGGDGKKIN